MSVVRTPKLSAKLLRLGIRTHSLIGDCPTPTTPGTITGKQYWPERRITVKRWPAGDIDVTVVDRKVREAHLVTRTKRKEGKLSIDDAARCARRASRRIRHACQEIKANGMLTVSKRGGFATRDDAWLHVGELLKLYKQAGYFTGHVTVLEVHDGSRNDGTRSGANLGTFHAHVAVHRANYFDYREMHEICRDYERKVFGNSPEVPSERAISVNMNKRPQGKRHTPSTTARYLSPYLTKDIEGSPRELHRKRYDVSRNREKAQALTICCSPDEVGSPEEVTAAILAALAPDRWHSRPYSQEIHEVLFTQQSANDWGYGKEPPCTQDLPNPDELWSLIEGKTDQAIGDSEAAGRPSDPSNWQRTLEAEREHLAGRKQRTQDHAKPALIVGAASSGRAAAASPDSQSQPDGPSLAALVTPWLDEMQRSAQNRTA